VVRIVGEDFYSLKLRRKIWHRTCILLSLSESSSLILKIDAFLAQPDASAGHITELNPTTSRNLIHLYKFVVNHNLIGDVLVDARMPNALRRWNPMLIVMQLMVTPFILSLAWQFPVRSFPISQKAVYEDMAKHPLLMGRDGERVNVELALHIVNFFKYHFTQNTQPMHANYEALDPSQRPQMWDDHLDDNPKKIEGYWLGAYSKRIVPIEPEWTTDRSSILGIRRSQSDACGPFE
jgi:hypothetical protein